MDKITPSEYRGSAVVVIPRWNTVINVHKYGIQNTSVSTHLRGPDSWGGHSDPGMPYVTSDRGSPRQHWWSVEVAKGEVQYKQRTY